MMKRNGIITFVLMLLMLLTWRVQPSQADSHFDWNYHALPIESIVTLREDAAGNLWVGSLLAGASMFDGQSWTTYDRDGGLSENTVQSIAFDQENTALLGHWQSGLTLMREGQVTAVRDLSQLQSGNVSVITVVDDVVWLGHMPTSTMMSGGGVTRLEGDSAETYDFVGALTSNAVQEISADADGNIWFAISDYITRVDVQTGGLVKFDGTEWTTYTIADGLPSSDVRALAIDGDTIWLSTPAGITKFDGQVWTTYTTADGLLSNENTAIAVDGNSTVWTISGSGVNYFADGVWNTLTRADGLLDDVVSTVAIDNAGNVMFVSESGISQMQSAENQHQVFMPTVVK